MAIDTDALERKRRAKCDHNRRLRQSEPESTNWIHDENQIEPPYLEIDGVRYGRDQVSVGEDVGEDGNVTQIYSPDVTIVFNWVGGEDTPSVHPGLISGGKWSEDVDRTSPEGRNKASKRALAGARSYEDPKKNLGDAKMPEPILFDSAGVAKSAERLADAFVAFNVDETTPDAWRDLALALLVKFTPAFRIQTRTFPSDFALNDDRDYEFLSRVADTLRTNPDQNIESAEKLVHKYMYDDFRSNRSNIEMPNDWETMKKMRFRHLGSIKKPAYAEAGLNIDAAKSHVFLQWFDEYQMVRIFQEAASRFRPGNKP